MNQRISAKRSVTHMIVGGAALLGVWVIAVSAQSGAARDPGAVLVSPAAMQQVLRCQHSERADGECAGVLHFRDASRPASTQKTLAGEPAEHRPEIA